MSETCTCVAASTRSIDVPRLQLGGAVVFGLGLVLTFAVSLWFSIMVDLAISAVLVVLAVVFARYRCERCVGAVHVDDLEPAERRSLRLQQALSLGIVAAMTYGALWAKGQWDAERGIGRAHPTVVDEASDGASDDHGSDDDEASRSDEPAEPD